MPAAQTALDPNFGASGATGHPEQADRSAIERLAYSYWQERGCPDGSAEEDWLRAEETLRADDDAPETSAS